MSMNVSRHTADGLTSPLITRVKGISASATTAGTVEIRNGSATGAQVAQMTVPINTSDSQVLDISCPDGAYVDITTFAGVVYVYGG